MASPGNPSVQNDKHPRHLSIHKKRRRCKEEQSSQKQVLAFPYPVDYNDHFETPLVAYQDILPLLDLVAPRTRHVLYDPYYCNGRTKVLLELLGFQGVQHRKSDFYKDIESSNIPQHDTLVTNPPYSSDHKLKCLSFAIKSLRESGRAFFLLMPNYIANKDYYRKATFLSNSVIQLTICPKGIRRNSVLLHAHNTFTLALFVLFRNQMILFM